jgi:hypothetical protein
MPMMWIMNASHHPTSSLLIADPQPRLVVDLSNVCRERALGGGSGAAVWGRFVSVMLAWQHHFGSAPHGIAIADANLRYQFSSGDRATFEAAERSGTVRSVAGSADWEILQLAECHHACVLSGDRFRDHRRRHPWIQGCTDRFFAWETSATGEPAIVASDMGHSSSFSLSRHAEIGELRDRGLDARSAAHRELLTHAYRCTSESCLTARLYTDRLLVPPELRDGEARCPDCGGPLTDLGPRTTAIKIVVEERSGARLLECALEESQELEVGREHLGTSARQHARVSRRHVLLWVHNGRLWARDLGSRNGTELIRWDKRGAEYEPALALGEAPLALGRRDLLVLAGAVRLRRSGERFPYAAPVVAGDLAHAAGRTTTTDGGPEPR